MRNLDHKGTMAEDKFEDYDMPGPMSELSVYSDVDGPSSIENMRRCCSFFYMLRMSKTLRNAALLTVVVATYVATALTDDTVTRFMFSGGVLSLIGAAFTMGVIGKGRNSGVFQLLFWRAFCDFFVGLRFVLVFDLNRMVCGSRECVMSSAGFTNSSSGFTNSSSGFTNSSSGFTNSTSSNSTLTGNMDIFQYEDLCGSQAAFLEFFEIASEMWFLCIALNMYISLMNPFASTKVMMKRYHMLVWSTSLAFCIPFGVMKGLAGFWYIDNDVDHTVICWMRSHNTFSPDSMEDFMWIMFLIPVLVVYFFAIAVMIIAFYRLQRGLSETLLNKMKALVINSVNVAVFIMFWTLWAIFYGLSLLLTVNAGGRWTARTTVFIFAAKGLTPLFVWILITNVSFSYSRKSRFRRVDDENLDLNAALRKEVLYYATKGIRKCTEKGVLLNETNERLLVRLHSNASSSKAKLEMSASFFLQLVLGFRSAIAKLEDFSCKMERKSLKSMAVRETFAFDDMDLDNNESEGADIVIPIHRREWWQKLQIRLTGRGGAHDAEILSYNNTKHVSMMESDRPKSNLDTQSTKISAIPPKKESRPSGFLSLGRLYHGSETFSGDIEQGITVADKNAIKNLKKQGEKTCFGELAEDVSRVICGKLTVEFEEFEPYHFRRVRLGAGISDEQYSYFFNTTIKERLTEGGASGAFFFFSRDEILIAKSCQFVELAVLKDNAKQYADYLESPAGSGSFISKIFGAYKLGIYGVDLYFFVMSNLFYTKEKMAIHQKYDLKGSTYSRSAEPPKRGQNVTCLHCEQKFVYRTKKRKAGKRSFKKALKQDIQAVASMAKNIGQGGQELTSNVSPMYISSGNDSVDSSGGHTPKRNVSFFSKPTTDNKNAQAIDALRKGSESSASSAPKGVSFALDPPASGSPKGVSFGNDPSPRDQDKNDMSAAVAVFSNYTNKCNFTVDGKHEPNVVLKDNDLKYKFKLHGSTAREVALQLEKDANFLLSIGVMDYSLLVGVHNNEFVIRGEPDNTQCQEVEPRNPSASNAYASRPETDLAYDDYDEESALLENIPAARRLEASRVIGADSYLFGIIDFQQKWTFQKKMERFLKIQFKGADPYGLSAIEPTVYKDRFVQHMRDVLDVQDFFCD